MNTQAPRSKNSCGATGKLIDKLNATIKNVADGPTMCSELSTKYGMTVTISNKIPKRIGCLIVNVPSIIAMDNPIVARKMMRTRALAVPPIAYVWVNVPIDTSNPIGIWFVKYPMMSGINIKIVWRTPLAESTFILLKFIKDFMYESKSFISYYHVSMSYPTILTLFS